MTDELRRLMSEFETELAILKGRVDGLEAKVGELEATQFSTTRNKASQLSLLVPLLKAPLPTVERPSPFNMTPALV